jgi:hypothetical protein
MAQRNPILPGGSLETLSILMPGSSHATGWRLWAGPGLLGVAENNAGGGGIFWLQEATTGWEAVGEIGNFVCLMLSHQLILEREP